MGYSPPNWENTMGCYSAITVSGTFRWAATWVNLKPWKVKERVVKHKRPRIPFVRTPKNNQTTVTGAESRPVVMGLRGQGRDCCQSAGAHHRATEASHTFTKRVATRYTRLPKLVKLCGLVTQTCPSLCVPTDCSPPGFSVHGIPQAKILEWIAIPFFWGSPQPRDQTQIPTLQAGSSPYELPGKPIKLYT